MGVSISINALMGLSAEEHCLLFPDLHDCLDQAKAVGSAGASQEAEQGVKRYGHLESNLSYLEQGPRAVNPLKKTAI